MTTGILVKLDDLLLDAQHELEEIECPELGSAVATARVRLIRLTIDGYGPPIVVEEVPDSVAPLPIDPVADDDALAVSQYLVKAVMPAWNALPIHRQAQIVGSVSDTLQTLFAPDAIAAAALLLQPWTP